MDLGIVPKSKKPSVGALGFSYSLLSAWFMQSRAKQKGFYANTTTQTTLERVTTKGAFA